MAIAGAGPKVFFALGSVERVEDAEPAVTCGLCGSKAFAVSYRGALEVTVDHDTVTDVVVEGIAGNGATAIVCLGCRTMSAPDHPVVKAAQEGPWPAVAWVTRSAPGQTTTAASSNP